MTPVRVATGSLKGLRISQKTVWHILRLQDEAGRIGHGEASLQGRAGELEAMARRLLPELSKAPDAAALLASLPPPRDLAGAAIRSAIDMALWELAAKATGAKLADALGGARRKQIRLYANINRRSHARMPESFAESARLALAQGYAIVKLAPFDEVTPEACGDGGLGALIEPALARVAAVRDAIGSDRALRVDCHWRFTPSAARTMIDALGPFGPDWIECPIRETPETIVEIQRLRDHAHARGTRLAGLEHAIGPHELKPFLDAGAYDVIMPDVKYLGGLARFREVEAMAQAAGALLSVHNPTGPVAHAVSLHVAAALEHDEAHEIQFDETPLFSSLLRDPAMAPTGGVVTLPERPGTGIDLDEETVARLAM